MNKRSFSNELETALVSLLGRLHDHVQKCMQQEQPFGTCIICPKDMAIGPPSLEVRKALEHQATEYFQATTAIGYCIRYTTPPPFLSTTTDRNSSSPADYHMIYELPQFDAEWQRSTLARELIYCPAQGEETGSIDWFEIQLEAIRFTPLLHQAIIESQILEKINIALEQPGTPEFETFIYEYAPNDCHLPPLTQYELEKWKKRLIDWKSRYPLLADLFHPSASLREVYIVAREKAASSRNSMIKDLLWGFVSVIEETLILKSSLPDEMKKQEIEKLRKLKKRSIKKGKYSAKRPAVCISDIECASILDFLCTRFFEQKQKSWVLVEGILFIWIAQHAAFSELNLKVSDILGIKVVDIDSQSLVIQINGLEISLTQGLSELIVAWIQSVDSTKSDLLFRKLNYDNLEELLNKTTTKLFGRERKLFPKDFLEKVHIIPNTRITLKLRRQITWQEHILKNSPYRINSQEIKKQIRQAMQANVASSIR